MIDDHIQEKIALYMEKGQIITYGARIRLEIEVNETLSPKEKNTIAKEVYRIVDEEARKQNITDVPVVFMSKPEKETTTESNSSDNRDSESDTDGRLSKNNSTPGFGLLGSSTCLYGGWKLRRK